jgi:hypothetical protein
MNSRRRFQLVLSVLVLTSITRLHANGITDLFGAIGNSVNPLYGDLISIDLSNNAAGTIIGKPTNEMNATSGLAFDNSGTLFANTTPFGAQPNMLLTINPTNGNQLSAVSITYLTNPLRIADLANSPLTDLLYGIGAGTSSTPGSLFTINKTTGIATLIGTPGIGTDGSIAFRADGTLWEVAHTGFAGELVQLDPLTGMPIGSTVALNLFYNALTIMQDGSFIGSPGNNGSGPIWKIDPMTPNGEVFWGNSNIETIGDLASRFAPVSNGVPEGGNTLALLGAAVLAMAAARCRALRFHRS